MAVEFPNLRRILHSFAGEQHREAIEARLRLNRIEYLAEWRKLCAEVGPWQYAADLGAPVDADLATIAYLAVWGDLSRHPYAGEDDDFIDEAISLAVAGFDAYLLAHPESVRPG